MYFAGIRSVLRDHGWLAAAAGAAALVRALAALLSYRLRDDLYTGDVCQHTWWMQRYRDASLFPHDLMAEYFSLPFLSPAGYRAIVGTAARVLDAQHIVETLAIVLALVAIALTAVLGHMIARRAGAAAALVVLWATHAEDLVGGGFPRSFGLVLVLAGMIALLRRWWAAFGGVVLACVLLYPPVLLNLFAPAATATVLAFVIRRMRPTRGFAVCVALSLAAAAVLASSYLRQPPPEIGRPFAPAEIQTMQEWRLHGRFMVLGYPPVFGVDIPNGGIGWSTRQVALGLGGLVLTCVLARRAIPAEGWALLAGAIVLWAIACVVLFRLYFPDRYLMYACPVFGMLWAAGVVRELGELLNNRAVRVLLPIAAAVFVMVVLPIDIASGVTLYRQPGDGTTARGYSDALKFIRKLPKNAIIAAHPDDANAVPLRCRRSVLVNTECALPIHTAYYAEMKRRLNDSFDLLYAADWDAAKRIAWQDHIHYFLLDTRRLKFPDDFPPYLTPYRRENKRRIANAKSAGFALLSPPAGSVIFRSGDMVLIEFDKPARKSAKKTKVN